MLILEWLQFVIGVAFLLTGLFVFVIQVFGVYKFGYVLNRMHAAAMGDTLGIGISLVGLIILSGWNFASLKMALIIVFLWNASPVSSHLIARLEATTNPNLERYCEVEEGVTDHLWDEDQREIIELGKTEDEEEIRKSSEEKNQDRIVSEGKEKSRKEEAQ